MHKIIHAIWIFADELRQSHAHGPFSFCSLTSEPASWQAYMYAWHFVPPHAGQYTSSMTQRSNPSLKFLITRAGVAWCNEVNYLMQPVQSLL
jgi:hypothetical protein